MTLKGDKPAAKRGRNAARLSSSCVISTWRSPSTRRAGALVAQRRRGRRPLRHDADSIYARIALYRGRARSATPSREICATTMRRKSKPACRSGCRGRAKAMEATVTTGVAEIEERLALRRLEVAAPAARRLVDMRNARRAKTSDRAQSRRHGARDRRRHGAPRGTRRRRADRRACSPGTRLLAAETELAQAEAAEKAGARELRGADRRRPARRRHWKP